MDRFILQRSETIDNGWVATDTTNGIVVTFEHGKYNDTQKVTFLEDNTLDLDADQIAKALREMADWLFAYHHFTVLPYSKEEANKYLGWLIKRLRTQQNLSVYELAKRANISKTIISRTESGEGGPSANVLLGILSALGVDVTVN